MADSAGVMLWLEYSTQGAFNVMLWWALFAVGGLVVMAALVRSGITASWRDPALTFPQILWAVTACGLAYVLAGYGKGVVPGLLALTLLFAALDLRAKQIVAVSLYAFGVFAIAIVFTLNAPSTPQSFEVAYASVVVLVLIGCMSLSLRLHNLRGRLRQQRQALAEALKENRELAARDVLTGLINRRHMLELLSLEQRRCARGTHSMLLAQLDIDHFKAINDTYGHGVGDMALKAFAEVVSANIRNSDVLARWGGEEFVLLLSDTDMEGALLTLNRVRSAVENTIIPGAPLTLKVTVSIGVARHLAGERLETTLDRADKALYCAKRQGRNRVIQEEEPCAPGCTCDRHPETVSDVATKP